MYKSSSCPKLNDLSEAEIKNNIWEADQLQREAEYKEIVPNYSKPINFYNKSWKISNPIQLEKGDKVKLDSGFYKIIYSLTGTKNSETSLHLKEGTKTQSIVYHTKDNQSHDKRGKQFINLKETGEIIAVSDKIIKCIITIKKLVENPLP